MTEPTNKRARDMTSQSASNPLEDIQQLMAHSEGATTAGYQDRHALPFAKVSLRLSLEVLDDESDDES